MIKFQAEKMHLIEISSIIGYLKYYYHVAIVASLLLVETIIVTLLTQNNIVVAIVAISGLIIIWMVSKNKQEKQKESNRLQEAFDIQKFSSNQNHKTSTLYNGYDIRDRISLMLSDRELQILNGIANGNSNKKVAEELKISQQTVKNHLKRIYSKLEVGDRISAITTAVNHGWIDIGTLNRKNIV
jgi:DNA-binding NarL/FixJ family response regulator